VQGQYLNSISPFRGEGETQDEARNSSISVFASLKSGVSAGRRVIERFGDPDRLVSARVSLVESAAFGEGARQGGTGHDGGRHHEAEPRTGPLAV
jgi:hypothetical protein